MPLQSGLRPFARTPPTSAAPVRRRTWKSPDITAPTCRQGGPGEHLQPAMTAPYDDNAQRLAAALSGIQPSLQRFADTMAQSDKEDTSSSVQGQNPEGRRRPEEGRRDDGLGPGDAIGLGKRRPLGGSASSSLRRAINGAKTKVPERVRPVNGDFSAFTAEA